MYKVTQKQLQENKDGTKTTLTVTVKSDLTFAEAKAMRKADRTLSITKE